MISKIIGFVLNHKKEILFILSLGLTLKINVALELNFNITYKTLLFVTIGYQVVKQITIVVRKKRNSNIR